MEKLSWRLREVIAYLEDAIRYDEVTEYEQNLYEDYHWYGKINTRSREFKIVLRNMSRKWNQ